MLGPGRIDGMLIFEVPDESVASFGVARRST